mgnify:FL=1
MTLKKIKKKRVVMENNDLILFEKIIDEATADCYGEHEQIAGWVCVLEENISLPYKCLIGREQAMLYKIERDNHTNFILGYIKLGKIKMRIPIEDIVVEDLNMMEYINAYKYWKKNW